MIGDEFSEGCSEETSKKFDVSYTDIAKKLLEDKFLLTALELHTEFIESGRELRPLKDFFSNPGNFELHTLENVPRLSRSGSQVTLDSLDLTRFSEDGGGLDERVAVLEFELRKARETINALRNNLTVATESENSTPAKGSLKNIQVGSIMPHEQRALNFLINEYLLLYGYKLTSITFADENQHQDFDDWDDVGLNVSKPPELLTLYREGLKQTGQNCLSTGTQTDSQEAVLERESKVAMEKEIENLNIKIMQLESEKMDFIGKVNVLQSQIDTYSSQRIAFDHNSSNNDNLNMQKDIPSCKEFLENDTCDRFEIIDKDEDKEIAFIKNRDNILDDTISNSSSGANDWTKLSLNVDARTLSSSKENTSLVNKEQKLEDLIRKDVFRKEIFSLCYLNFPSKFDNDLLEYVLNNSATESSLINILSQSLLKIIPNIILNKREEAIPLLISAVQLHSNSSERDKLLQQLFNLKKKPSDVERNTILIGILGIAKHSEESLVENEILPQCWEQLTHRYVERRLLVVEASIALMPYISNQLRNSLVLSMLQQMIEDKEESVRVVVVKALSLLLALCDDADKYDHCEQLALKTLDDGCTNVVSTSTEILFPALGKWALELEKLNSCLMKHLLQKLNTHLKDTGSPSKSDNLPDKILRIINVIENLLPFLLMSVASNENVLSNVEKEMERPMRSDLLKLCNNLTNPMCFHNSDKNEGVILYEFDKFICTSSDVSWKEMDWILDIMIPDLLNNINHIEINQHVLLNCFIRLFSHICIVFGKNFTKFKISPIFQVQVNNLEQILQSFNQYSPSLNIIPIYLVSVLSYCDHDELLSSLKKFICVLPLCGTPLDCLEITVKGLCDYGLQDIVVTSLWEGVVHQRPLARGAAATLFASIIGNCSANLLVTKVSSALVTLASDNDMLVKAATIPALGCLITDCNIKEIHDKTYMQLQTFVSDASLKENHTLLRQLMVTFGNIVNSCSPSFRSEVILPNLSSYSFFMLQMSNPTRKVDMALALIEAYSNVVYSTNLQNNYNSLIIPALRCLETVTVENQSLLSHHETVLNMIRECDNKYDLISPQSPVDRSNRLSQNVNQGVEEMRQRVSKIFQKPTSSKPNTLPNLQGIFKKK